VVRILRNVDQLSIAQIEQSIADFGKRAKDGKLSIEELSGGTFSITNGGVFGSMLSTPIINPPQSAILGVHATKDRAVVENGQVVVRPMNYLALSYDHRIIDGREAVLLARGDEGSARGSRPPVAGRLAPGGAQEEAHARVLAAAGLVFRPRLAAHGHPRRVIEVGAEGFLPRHFSVSIAWGAAVAITFSLLKFLKHPPMFLKNVHPLAAGCARAGRAHRTHLAALS
jgi:hypothetical protein